MVALGAGDRKKWYFEGTGGYPGGYLDFGDYFIGVDSEKLLNSHFNSIPFTVGHDTSIKLLKKRKGHDGEKRGGKRYRKELLTQE